MLATRILGISLVVAATISDAEDSRVRIGFPGIFSGRPDPMVQVTDSAQAQRLLDTLAVRLASNSTCVLTDLTTLGYNGVRLDIDDPVLGKKTVTVREGCLSAQVQDADRNLERLAVGIAFLHDDLNSVGGPQPLTYLACTVPQWLHPDIAPCSTTSVKHSPVIDAGSHRVPSLSATATRSTSIDGRQVGPRKPVISWSSPPR